MSARLLLSSLLFFTLLPTGYSATEYDIIVYGGTSAGVAAAVQVSRMGKTVALIEPGRHLGGLSSSGLGWTDSGDKSMIGGISKEFYQRIKQHYDAPSSWPLQNRETLNIERGAGLYTAEADTMWVFEPHVAEAVFDSLTQDAAISVFRQQRLNRDSGVKKTGTRIDSITMESGQVFSAPMYIDATYEGDLMAAAGVDYIVGRESNDRYQEHYNGVYKGEIHNHFFPNNVDPYIIPGDKSSGLVARVHDGPSGKNGDGDQRIQAYNYRMCMSDDDRNRVPFKKPDGYDESQYELLFRNFESGDLRLPLNIGRMPNHKTDTNNFGAFSTDNIGMNYRYPDASYAEREAIIKEHQTYQKGLMWTLANHPRVPQGIRDQMASWGLAADEFADNDHWPYQIYVREARRMIGSYVTTEADCRRLRVANDSIGVGSYYMDSHNTQRYITQDGYVQNGGGAYVSPGGPYVISYRSITPRQEQIQNLLVPVALSSSHIAYGSIRMEPVFMILGQSAATAAVMALDAGSSVQNLPYSQLRERLLQDGQVLDLPDDATPLPVPGWFSKFIASIKAQLASLFDVLKYLYNKYIANILS